MPFAVLFEDAPKIGRDVRKELMPDHLLFLEKHANKVKYAGPLLDVDGRPAGGLWIVYTNEFEAIENLIKEDPFWTTGLRKSFRILRWNDVLADGHRV